MPYKTIFLPRYRVVIHWASGSGPEGISLKVFDEEPTEQQLLDFHDQEKTSLRANYSSETQVIPFRKSKVIEVPEPALAE